MLAGGSHAISMVQPFVPLTSWLAVTFCGISGTPGAIVKADELTEKVGIVPKWEDYTVEPLYHGPLK